MALKSDCMDSENRKHNVCNSETEGPTFPPMESLKERRTRVVGRQVDLAKLCDCHHTHISHIESGHTDPSLEVFVKMTAALDISAAKLLQMLKARNATASVTDLQNERERRKRR